MLLPVVILQTNVKKILAHPFDLTIKLGWAGRMWEAILALDIHFFHIPLAATTTAKNYYFPKWWQQNLNETFSENYYHVVGCHKRETQQFFQQMTNVEQQVFLKQLKSDYSQILINYFTTDKTLKQKIDKFINTVFCANIPVPQIIEIHMELIDEFSKQLKMEGRNEESLLLDYRLTLIDILAHLCEVYRRSTSK